MIEIKDTCYKGTRILVGNEKRELINNMIKILQRYDFQEIQIPNIQFQDTFKNKVGEENNNLMFNFKDRGDRDLCLAPEYTAVMQELAKTHFKQQKDVKLFYVLECFRGEKPQAGRYRQFTQLGVEILNPDYYEPHQMWWLAQMLLTNDFRGSLVDKYFLNDDVTRGLDYYKNGKGFEIVNKSSMQVCGGGEYEGGMGFAIGIDRII